MTSQKTMREILDPAAVIRTAAQMEAERREVIEKLDGSALANHQDLTTTTPALPTNRIVSYPSPSYTRDSGPINTEPEPKMPSAHFEIKEDGKVETLVQPEERVYVHQALTPERKDPDYDWSEGVPQFVDDLEGAIDGFLKDQPALDRASSASEIAAELLKHPALQGYLVQDCEYQHGDVDLVSLEEPSDIEAAHLAQFERYADEGDVVRKGDQIGVAGHTGIDWVSYTPSEQEFLGNVAEDPETVPGEGNTAGWERWERRKPQLMAQAKAGIAALQELAGMAAEHKGFHEDRPVQGPELANWQGNKLMLIVSEVVEAHDEIRSGHTSYETYYPSMPPMHAGKAEGTGEYKPEGVPSEIADAVIRSADFAWTEGFDLADIIIEKLEFNATRGHKHGKAF